MKKEKKVVFLGGCFQAEFSMRASLMANGVKCYYLYDSESQYTKEFVYSNYNQNRIITIVPDSELKKWLKSNKPDVIIHRFYKDISIMHPEAYSIAKSLNIPYAKYLMETDNCDVIDCKRFDNCDFVLYAHDTIQTLNIINSNKIRKNCYFYPYGVGVNEYSDKKIRTNNIASFGYSRFGIKETIKREKIFKMFLNATKAVGLKLNVFDAPKGVWGETEFLDDIIINPSYRLEQEHRVMNKFKIALNFESVHDVEGAYSHKMFQTAGRGIATITYRKKCLESMFGFSGENLIFVENARETAFWIYFLLKNEKFRQELEERCEKFIHEHYDWYKRFEKIMIKENIWK